MQAGRSGSRRLQTTVLLPVFAGPLIPGAPFAHLNFCITASLAGVITPPNSENRKAHPAGQYAGSHYPISRPHSRRRSFRGER
jgi:hypothetical protein